MKKPYLYNVLIWLASILIWPMQPVFGQNISSSNQGGDACPNQTYTYSISTACTPTWAVAGGTITQGKGTSTISVVWNDAPTSPSNPTSVSVSLSGCTNAPPGQRLDVFVSSISNKSPGPLTINGTQVSGGYTLPFGDVATLALYVPLVAVPNTTGNQFTALTYDWVIPNGWRYNDGSNVVSNGTTPHRVGYNSNSGQAGNQISVTSHPGNGGSISVQAINTNCVGASTGPVNSVSQSLYVSVSRSTPKLTIISDKSPNGGNFSLICGDQSNYHFRSTSDPLPAGGIIDNYVFNFKGANIITPIGDVPGTNPVTNFTGAIGTAGVDLSARYTRNGVSTTLSASNVAITVQTPPKPVITSSVASPGPGLYPLLCGASARITLSTSLPGATSYTWKATGGLGLNGPGVSTLTTSSSSVIIFPGSGSGGEGLVTVSATNANVANCASPASDGYGVAYGGAYQDGSVVQHADGFDYETNCPGGCAGFCPDSRVTMQVRNPSHTAVLEAVWKIYRTDVSPAQLLATQSFSGSTLGNSMANYLFRGSVVGNRYRIELQQRNSCGWGPIVYHPLEVINCGGGYEPFRVGTSHATSQTTAYPNPTDDALTLEQGGGPVVLTDAQGRPVRSQKAQPGSVRLDTRSLPAGLYFLEMRDAAGKPVRQQIRVTH